MATRNVGKMQQSSLSIPFEQIEKTSNTLKRHPKMELTKPDLLQLLGVLEGELQAREIAIAVLKAEQVKQLLYPNKKCSVSDPLSALQRDSFGAFDATFDESTVKNLYNMQLSQLENFIEQQKNAQNKLREQLQLAEERCEKLLQELEDEKRKHAQDTAQGDDVTYLLEKERERLRQENEFERQQNRCMEKDIKCLSETLEQERLRQKQIVLLLLAERKRLILRYVEEKQKSDRLCQILTDEKGRIADMVDGLEEESKKSLQMEAEMERQLCEFEIERDQFKIDMSIMETRNNELQLELQKLQEELETTKKQATAALAQAQLGEGVRSAIVTIVSTPAICAAPTVSPTVSPPRGVARAVTTKVGPAPATPAKPPGLIPQVLNKPPAVPPPKPVTAISPGGMVTAQPISPGIKSPPRPKKAVSPVPNLSPDVGESSMQSDNENIMSPPETDKIGMSDSNSQKNLQSGPKSNTSIVAGKVQSVSATSTLSAKKLLPIGRGTPPPIPPNKPVLQPQALHRKDPLAKPPVPPRTEMPSETTDAKKSAIIATRYGVIQPKSSSLEERLSSSSSIDKEDGQVGLSSDNHATVDATTNNIITSIISSNNLGSEVLDQELADFQQVLVSMATNNVDNL